MPQEVLTRRKPDFGAWTTLVAISASAVLVGVVVAQGHWLYLAAIVLVPLLWFWPVEVAIGIFVVLLPFEQIEQLNSGPVLASLALVLTVCVLCAVGFFGHRLEWPPRAATWWGLFLAWTAATTLWAMQPKLSLMHLLPAVALFLFYLVASSFRISEKEFNWMVSATILGGGAVALFSMYEFYNGMIIAAHQARASLVAGDTEANPNRFAVRLLLPLSFSIARFLSARHWLARLVALVFMVITSAALLLTMSRGSLLAAIVIILIFVLRLPVLRSRMALVIVMAVALSAAMPAGLFLRVEKAAQDRGAGRLDIWEVGLVALEHHGVIGAGFSNFPYAYSEYAGYAPHFRHFTNDAHNIYLLIAVEEGMVGLLLFLIALKMQFNIVSRCRRYIRGSELMLVSCEAAFCGILVAGFFTSIVWEKTFWLSCVCLMFAATVQSSRAGLINEN